MDANIQLCLLCSGEEEYRQIQTVLIHDSLNGSSEIKVDNTNFLDHGILFTTGVLNVQSRHISFFLSYANSQGPESFGIFASKIFTIFKPKVALLLGICTASRELGWQLGDVAFGSSAYNCEESNYLLLNDIPTTQLKKSSDMAHMHITSFLAQNIQRHYRPATFLTGSSWTQELQSNFQRWAQAGLADVLDREASAFFNACVQCDIPALGVVKGVVMVDMQVRDALWNTVALSEATKACMQLVKHYYAHSQSNEPASLNNGAKMAFGYFQNFLQETICGLFGSDLKLVQYEEITEKVEKKLYIVDPGLGNLSLLQKPALAYHVRLFNLRFAAISRQTTRPLTLYYKKGKVFDFPTILSQLEQDPEKEDNYHYFWKTIQNVAAEHGMLEELEVIPFSTFQKLCQEEA